MAQQPISVAYQPGRTVIVNLRDLLADKWWNTATPGWETYDADNVEDYKISVTDPLSIGTYTAPFPTAISDVDVTQFAYDTENLTNPIGSSLILGEPAAATTPLDSGSAVVSIVNRALSAIGSTVQITSLDDDSIAAEQATLHFDKLRDGLLRSHYWKFASYIDTLAQLEDETIPQWLYLYAYPSKCLMVRRIFDDACSNPAGDLVYDAYYFGELWILHHPEYRYKEVLSTTSFTKAIAANVTPAYIEYTYQVTDPNLWDENFQEAMVYSLAAKLATPVAGKSDMAKSLMEVASQIVSEAKRLDSQEDNSRRPEISTYVRART